ncbi:hypothetical protein, partial [Stutzerimonas stutzeri]|uniref:hypothetical protein n=1 Tax=Stutzerimonas stutzeri TaxID=316 RepID=UPI0024481798
FAQTPKTSAVVVTGAATVADDNPTNTVELLTAGADGALVTRLAAMPRATCTASSLVLFLQKSGQATKRLIDSELMSALTVAATTAIPETVFANVSDSTPMRLEAGDKLFVGSQVALAAGIVFAAQWMDY